MVSPDLLLAQSLVKSGQLAEAEAILASVPLEGPDGLLAGTGLAGLYLKTSRIDQAVEKLGALLAFYGERDDLIGLMLAAQKGRGDWQAVAHWTAKLLERAPSDPRLHIQLGSALLELDDSVGAGTCFRRAIELDRQSPFGYLFLGLALKSGGKSFEAFETFRRVIAIDPNFLDAYIELWLQMRQLLNWDEGLPLLEQGHRRLATAPRLTVALAETYSKVGRTAEAETLYQTAIQADPKSITAYGHFLHEQGRFEESIPLLEESVRLIPDQGMAYYLLSIAKASSVSGRPLVEAASEVLTAGKALGEEEMFLHYALAKTFDSQKETASAMRHYDEANAVASRLFHLRSTFEDAEAEKGLDAIQQLFSRTEIERLSQYGSRDATPVFIVGMIRTGTTLLDTILAAHPEVSSVGEQPYWQIVSGRTNRRWLETGAKPQDINELVDGYLKVLHRGGNVSGRITDKMPTNFAHIGLMSLCFPNAKFIHTRREPMDTAISIYTTFLGRGTQFAYDQQRIVDYYLEYLSYMEHWRDALPEGRMIEIDYEDLVSDKERILRSVLTFCGLGWDDAVLQHETQSNQVSTPSLWTVRQPVNTGSVGRWKRYEPYLRELLQLKDIHHPAIAGTPS